MGQVKTRFQSSVVGIALVVAVGCMQPVVTSERGGEEARAAATAAETSAEPFEWPTLESFRVADSEPVGRSTNTSITADVTLAYSRWATLSASETQDDDILSSVDFVSTAAQTGVASRPRMQATYTGAPRASTFTTRAGLGFTLDPSTVHLAAGAEYFFTENLAVGPLLQFGVGDDWLIVAPTINGRWVFDFEQTGIHRIKPYVQVGAGIAYIEKEKVTGDEDDVGVLINAGFGVDYYVTDPFAIGSSLLFNFLPGDVQDETFFFSWQILAATYHF